MIDICDFAVGLSRQLYGLIDRLRAPGPPHGRAWHPLGPVGVITAFNFPVAVWSWNAALALVCGDPVIWKPSERTPLTAIAMRRCFERAAERFGGVPDGLAELVDRRSRPWPCSSPMTRASPLVSATGSTSWARRSRRASPRGSGARCSSSAATTPRSLTPALISTSSCAPSLFAAVGTAGQRCTSLRRLIVHESIADELVARSRRLRERPGRRSARAGHARRPAHRPARRSTAWRRRSARRVADGGEVVVGGGRALAERGRRPVRRARRSSRMPAQTDVVREETFGPILYVLRYRELDEAIAIQNGVPQGLVLVDLHDRPARGRALPRGVGLRLRHRQREHRARPAPRSAARSAARRRPAAGASRARTPGRPTCAAQTATVNYSDDLPLAQGIVFESLHPSS